MSDRGDAVGLSSSSGPIMVWVDMFLLDYCCLAFLHWEWCTCATKQGQSAWIGWIFKWILLPLIYCQTYLLVFFRVRINLKESHSWSIWFGIMWGPFCSQPQLFWEGRRSVRCTSVLSKTEPESQSTTWCYNRRQRFGRVREKKRRKRREVED